MKYIVKPSLEYTILLKIVIMFWNKDDVRALMRKYRFPLLFRNRIKEWQKIEDKVIEKVLQLPQLGLLTEKLLGFIKPIGLQILKWMEYHCTGLYLYVNLPAEFCWTPEGILDKRKTAEVLIKKENVDLCMCYKLACIYCLEDDIPELWEKIPGRLRESLSFEDCTDKSSQRDIVIFWINGIREERWSNPFFSYKSVFESYAKTGNKVATEFFLQKLTPTEREASLVKTAKYVTDADVFFYLLTEMDEQQQRDIFKSDPYRVLECFLDWPVQCFFMEVADLMWNYLSKWDYSVLLKIIIDKITYGYKDWDYERLFGKFWEKSPDVFKSYIINEVDNGFLLSLLFKIKDTENLKLILQDATLEEKEKLIYCDRVQYICQDLIYDDEWELLALFIRECLPAEEEMIKFKEKFEGCIMSRVLKDHLERNKHKWNQLFGLPVDSICKYNNIECVEEVKGRSGKRLCRIQ